MSWAQSSPRSGSQDLKAKVDELYETSQKNFQETAKALNALNEIKVEFQSIKGTLDSSKFQNQESQKVYQDLDMRVSALEDKISQIHDMLKELKVSTPEPVKNPAAPTAPTAAKLSTEYDEFQSLLAMVSAQDYRNSAAGFMGFIKKYPKSEYLASAQFWMADSFYSMGDYAKAIAEYQTLAEKFPTHPRVKEAVYKQGLAFMRLKKYPEAKLFFQKVLATYPNSSEAAESQARLHRVEELEGTNMALGGDSKPIATPKPVPSPGAAVYNVPVMKPNAYPGANPPKNIPPPATLPPAQPTAQPPAQAPTANPPPTTNGSGAPLF